MSNLTYRLVSRLLLMMPGLLLAAVPSGSQGNEPFIQADVYNALFDAYVQCDDDLDLTRSEFITDELERNAGNTLSMELLTKLLAYNVETAKQAVSDKTQERELQISEMLRAPKVSSEESVEEAKASKERHEKIRQIDDFLKRERRYVEVRECVLTALNKTPHSSIT
jgi:hypothetical protein